MARLINDARTPASLHISVEYDHTRPDKGFVSSTTIRATNQSVLWAEELRWNGELIAWLPSYAEAGARALVRHTGDLELITMALKTKYRIACERVGERPRR